MDITSKRKKARTETQQAVRLYLYYAARASVLYMTISDDGGGFWSKLVAAAAGAAPPIAATPPLHPEAQVPFGR